MKIAVIESLKLAVSKKKKKKGIRVGGRGRGNERKTRETPERLSGEEFFYNHATSQPGISVTVEALLSHTRSRAHNDLPRARTQKIVKNSCRLLCLLIESPQADTLL